MALSKFYYVRLDSDLERGSSLATISDYAGVCEDGDAAETELVRHAPAGTELVVLDCRARLVPGTRVVISEDGRIVRRAKQPRCHLPPHPSPTLARGPSCKSLAQ